MRLLPAKLCTACAGIAVGCCLLIALGWALTLERIAYEREEGARHAMAQNENLALAFEEHIRRTIQGLDRMVRFIRHEYIEERGRPDLRYLLGEAELDNRAITTAAVVDAKGKVVFSITGSEGGNVADREYFAFHRAVPDDELRIGRPLTGRFTGRTTIHLTRPLHDRQGGFAGVVLVGVDPQYFASFYGRIDLHEGGVVLLAGLDGQVRARRTGASLSFGQDLAGSRLFRELGKAPAGSYAGGRGPDGVLRYVSYRQLKDHPLVVAVGTAQDDALGAFEERRRNYLTAASLASVFIVMFAALLIAARRRQQIELAAKRAAEARYRATFDHAAVGVTHAAPDGRFLRANPAYCAMLGYTEAELLQRRFLDVIHEEDRGMSDELRAHFVGGGALSPAIEHREVRKDGSLLWVSVAVSMVRDAAGRPEYFIAMVRDIGKRKQAEDALRESEARFRSLTELSSDFYWETDAQHRFTSRGSGGKPSPVGTFEKGNMLGKRRWEIAYLSPGEAGWREHRATLEAHMPFRGFELSRRRDDGSEHFVSLSGDPVFDEAGHFEGYRGVGTDITERKRAELRLRESEARYRATFEQSATGIVHASLEGRILGANRKFCRMLGYEESELVGRTVYDVTHPDDRRTTLSSATRLAAEAEGSFNPEYEKRYVRRDGSLMWASVWVSAVRDAGGVPQYFIAMVNDISSRKAAEEKLVHHAHYDVLTDLPNRVLCFDRLSQAIAQAGRKRWNAGVLFIDLDRFKTVNDTLGHASGDAVLRLAAQRLQGCVRGGDTVARVGGDEFVVVLAELASPQDGAVVAQKIVDAMARPLRFDDKEIYITTSIGIATFPADGRDGEALVKNADAAMLRAKQVGRNNFQFYTAAMNERVLEKLQLEIDLRRALERSEFFLHYQPKVSLASGRITGVEALLRWNRPGQGPVPPAQFVPILEDCGLIVPVGDWIVDAACAQARAWRDAGLAPTQIAVNLAAKQFLHHDIGAVIDAALARHGIPGALLQVEITESDAMAAPEQASAMLARLKQRGVTVAIDDFGTGYSSLGYLKRFPLDTLKLDRSFVTGLPGDADDVSIALAVIGMAHSLGLKVVAEGVEKREQREFLGAHGCDEMQGYLFSRPVTAEACARLLQPASATLAA